MGNEKVRMENENEKLIDTDAAATLGLASFLR